MTTPTCPACGTKFAHDADLQRCRVCGLPDEWVETGRVSEWRRAMLRAEAPSKRKYKEQLHSFAGGSAGRKRNKHGRKGVRNI